MGTPRCWCVLWLFTGLLLVVEGVPQRPHLVTPARVRPQFVSRNTANNRQQRAQQRQQQVAQKPRNSRSIGLRGTVSSQPQQVSYPQLPQHFSPQQRIQRLQRMSQMNSEFGSPQSPMPQQPQPRSELRNAQYQRQRQRLQHQPQQQQQQSQYPQMPRPQPGMRGDRGRQQRAKSGHIGPKRASINRGNRRRKNVAARMEAPKMSLNHHLSSLSSMGLSTKTVNILRRELENVEETKDGSLMLGSPMISQLTQSDSANGTLAMGDEQTEEGTNPMYPALDFILQLMNVWQQLRLMECTPAHRQSQLHNFQDRLVTLNHECDLLINSKNRLDSEIWMNNMNRIVTLKKDISVEWSQLSANVNSDGDISNEHHSHHHHNGHTLREELSMAEHLVTDDFDRLDHAKKKSKHSRIITQHSDSSSSHSSNQLDDRCAMRNGRLSMRINKLKEGFSGILINAGYPAVSKLTPPTDPAIQGRSVS